MSVRLNALRQKRGEIADKMDGLVQAARDEDRDLNEAEDQVFKDYEAEIAKIDAMIKREEQVEKIKQAQAKPVKTGAADPPKAFPRARVRYGSLKAFRGEDAEERAFRSGMFLKATLMRDDSAMTWCRENNVPIVKAQSESVNTAGGYLVIPEFEQSIIDLREMYGVFRQNCRLVPMGSDSMTIPRRAGGVTAYFVGENDQITESQKAWNQVLLSAKKIGALTRLSTELAEDAVINIADDLAQEMAWAFAKLEDSCGWNGDGQSGFGGITGAAIKIVDGTHTASAIDAASGHDTFAEIDATDLANVMGALPKYAEMNARWYCSQTAWAVVFQRIIAAAGGTSMTELTGGKPTRSFLGYPVVLDQTLPTTTGAINNVPMLFFGDLSLAARMGERRGITVKTSGERYFEFDQIGIQATERVDINVHDLGDNTTAGPLVALIGNT